MNTVGIAGVKSAWVAVSAVDGDVNASLDPIANVSRA